MERRTVCLLYDSVSVCVTFGNNCPQSPLDIHTDYGSIGSVIGYTKLFQDILTSTLWGEDDKTRIVWITILALKDQNHFVPASIPGLARQANVSLKDCEKAIKKLEGPDPYSRSQEHDGRRIERKPGGWLVLNGEKYRKRMNEEERREYKRLKQREYREQEKLRNGLPKNVPTKGERVEEQG